MEGFPLPETVLVIHGVAYIKPYIKEKIYSVRLGKEGQTVPEVLGQAFKHASQELFVAVAHFVNETKAGRVCLERHKNSRDDNRPFTNGFSLVVDPNMLTERGDRIRVTRHVHERIFALNGPIPVLWRSADSLVCVVNKVRCIEWPDLS
jgi:hypothetical protein